MIGKISKKKKRGLDDLDLDDERGSSSSSRSSRAKRQSIVSTFRRPSVTPAASSVSAAPRTFKLQFKDIFFDSRLECQVDPGTGEVTFQSEPSFVSEVLKISEDWLKGYDLLRGIKSTSYNLHSHYEYGVLGMGYFKLGVEACYNDEPMVVLFYHGDGFASDMASEEAKAGLQNELEALKLAQDVFLPAFESLLRETGFKTMPKLHFNAEKAFLGRITIPEPVTARKIDVQHPQGYADGRTYTVMESGGWFLATALLPYGPTKPQVIKFTGTDADGESPRDASDKDKLGEEVAQAFAHFVYVYSKESRLLVDLQGVWAADGTQTITLIDPQLLKSEVRDDKVKIDRYMKSHSCRRLCQALHLHDTKAASPSPSNQDDDDDPSGDYRDEADELYDDDY
ncbi:hypothetical protein FRB90_007904 [Tulasnella sp. 427]|nr:hypothetical protein FRB90_007904 [Tulasnella sp. 427]